MSQNYITKKVCGPFKGIDANVFICRSLSPMHQNFSVQKLSEEIFSKGSQENYPLSPGRLGRDEEYAYYFIVSTSNMTGLIVENGTKKTARYNRIYLIENAHMETQRLSTNYCLIKEDNTIVLCSKSFTNSTGKSSIVLTQLRQVVDPFPHERIPLSFHSLVEVDMLIRFVRVIRNLSMRFSLNNLIPFYKESRFSSNVSIIDNEDSAAKSTQNET